MNKKVAQQYEASLTAYNDVCHKRDLVMQDKIRIDKKKKKSEFDKQFKLLIVIFVQSFQLYLKELRVD